MKKLATAKVMGKCRMDQSLKRPRALLHGDRGLVCIMERARRTATPKTLAFFAEPLGGFQNGKLKTFFEFVGSMTMSAWPEEVNFNIRINNK